MQVIERSARGLCAVSTVVFLTVSMLVPLMGQAASYVPPIVEPWEYRADECTNFIQFSKDCRYLDGGTFISNHDPCESQAHPRPWPDEAQMQPILTNYFGGDPVSFNGWLSPGGSTYCVGFFDTGRFHRVLGIEADNYGLFTVDDDPDKAGAWRHRDISCPIGTRKVGEECQRFTVPDPYKACPDCNGTNPVNTFMSEKTHRETDHQGVGPNPLSFTRYYSSRTDWRRAEWDESGMDRYWRHNYSRRVSYAENNSHVMATVFLETGNREYFERSGSAGNYSWSPSDSDFLGELALIWRDDEQLWEYRNARGEIERYDFANGRLIEILSAHGHLTELSYDSLGRLTGVANGFGRELVFEYGTKADNSDQFLIRALHVYHNGAPVTGSTYRYDYANQGRYGSVRQLVRVWYPDDTPEVSTDNPFKTYHYDEAAHIYRDQNADVSQPSTDGNGYPYGMTGITDENGDRYATYKYQLAIFSGGAYRYVPRWGGHGEKDAVTGRYPDEYRITREVRGLVKNEYNVVSDYNTITDAMGVRRNFRFRRSNYVLRLVDIDGPRCPGCGSNTQTIDRDGSGKIYRTRDTAGNQRISTKNEHWLETCLIEGVSNSDAAKKRPRRIVTSWDSQFRTVTEKRIYEPQGSPDLTQCEVNNNSGWDLRRQTVNTYEPGSARLATRSVHSFNDGVNDAPPRVTSYTYYPSNDPNGLQYQLKSVDGPRAGNVDQTHYVYATTVSEHHSPGDLLKITNALGQETRITAHDLAGRPETIVDPNGLVTQLRYHPRGWLSSRTVDGYETRFDYDAVGQLKRVSLPDGSFLAYDYDSAHRLVGISNAAGETIEFDLDPAGNRRAEKTYDATSALRRSVTRVYDQLSQLEQLIDGNGNVTHFSYDANGNLTQQIDPRDPSPLAPSIYSARTYDALDRVSTLTNADGGIVTLNYDVFDNVVSVVDPNGVETRYSYNGHGDLTSLFSPDAGHDAATGLNPPASVTATEYRYDEAGNRISTTDARGITVAYVYDELNRLRLIDYPTDQDTAYIYDENTAGENGVGRLTRMIDETGSTTYRYDLRGNLLSKHHTHPALGELHTSYTYDAAGNVKTIRYPSTMEVSYERNNNGQVTRVSARLPGSAGSIDIATNISYEPFGPLKALEFGNGIRETRVYDVSGQLTQIASSLPALNTFDYEFDAAGNLIQETRTFSAGAGTQQASRRFQYDNENRLTYQFDDAYSWGEVWGYDLNGNRLAYGNDFSTGTPSAEPFYATIAGTNRLDKADSEGNAAGLFSYDATGNLLANAINTPDMHFAYDEAGRRTVTDYAPGDTASLGTDWDRVALYNGLGERTILGYVAPFSYTYQYDGPGQLLSATHNAFGLRVFYEEYIRLDNQIIARTVTNIGTNETRIGYAHSNHIGQLLALTNPDQELTYQAASISAFGAPVVLNADPDSDGIEEKPMLSSFPGQIADPIFTGDVYYNYFRDYHAVAARYLQSDPIGLAGGGNTYSYADNSPLRFSDPLGLVAWKGTLTGGVATEGFGAGYFSINLTSECVAGRRATVDILAAGPALGLGGFLEVSTSELEVSDGFDYLKPDNFNGGFQITSAGYALLVGYGGYAVSIGDGRYDHPIQHPRRGATGSGHGVIKGYGAGVSSVMGTSTVKSVRYECCDK